MYKHISHNVGVVAKVWVWLQVLFISCLSLCAQRVLLVRCVKDIKSHNNSYTPMEKDDLINTPSPPTATPCAFASLSSSLSSSSHCLLACCWCQPPLLSLFSLRYFRLMGYLFSRLNKCTYTHTCHKTAGQQPDDLLG